MPQPETSEEPPVDPPLSLRFRLFLYAMIIACIGIPLAGWWWIRYRTAVALELQGLGGDVIFFDGQTNVLFQSPRRIYLNSNKIDDALASHISRYGNLQELDLRGGELSEVGMADLGRLTQLKSLFLSNMQISGGLEHLENLTDIEDLMLYGASISNEDLKTIGRLTNLRSLNLGRTQITDAGLQHLSGLTKLQELWLSNINISDAGLAFLPTTMPLELLDLSGTNITDDGLAQWKLVTAPRILDLRRTQVTGHGFASIPFL